MNLYAVSSLLAATICVTLGVFVCIKRSKNILNQSFSLTSILIGLWSLFPFLVNTASSDKEAIFLARLTYIAAAFTPSAFFHFVFTMIEINKRKLESNIIKIFYVVSVLFLFLLPSPIFIKGIIRNAPYSAIVPGALYPLYAIFFGILCPYAIYQIFITYRKTTGYKRNQLKYLFFAFFIALAGGMIHLSSAYWRTEIFPHDTLLIIWAVTVTYAIMKYRLMDITIALTRTSIFIATYTLILGLPFGVAIWLKTWLVDIFGSQWWTLPLGLMAVLATVGPFIYIYIDRKAEAALLKEQRRYQDTLKQASIGMTRIRDLKKLLALITHIVTKTVRIEYAAIYLFDKSTDEYTLQVRRDKDTYSIPKVSADLALIAWVKKEREPLIYEEIKRKAEEGNLAYAQLEENMRLLSATVIIPSFLESRLLGFFVLGDKMSGQVYTPDDLNVFHILATQAALAIENAQFYEEAQDMQDQISQAEKMATIGTMANGLSHQINNRFYALSLIAGDSIDTLKMTDTSKCTPEIQSMLGEINHALERIQSNVNQGGEVVRGLLKYSRKGDEGYEPLDINDVIDNTLEMVQFKVKLSEIDIIRNFPDSRPRIKGNMTQLQEVFFNFIDNANDAINERKDTMKEPGYRGKIIISAKPLTDNSIEITVEDNGMGVKNADNKKIFTPFFTTKASSRKGTGLGLYVIKRIITEMHKGKIDFESQHQKGTRFILELPIAG